MNKPHLLKAEPGADTVRRRQGIRWGLCCLFKQEPIHFGIRQATYLARFARSHQLHLLAGTVRSNGTALIRAIEFCSRSGIGAFRINSRIFPLKTHPQLGYRLEQLPDHAEIATIYEQAGEMAKRLDIRLSFHPDQFTLLSSPDEGVTARSFMELEYQAEVASLVGADVITLHGGGGYGDKQSALQRLIHNIDLLPEPVRSRLALENDDRVYTPADLLPVCERTGIPFVYDVHHHRCLPDGLAVEAVTARALASWTGEPLFHLSSPREGWQSPNPRPHHDFIDSQDLPRQWLILPITVEVEAKAKELALKQLQEDIVLT